MGINILIVDDSSTIRSVLKRTLEMIDLEIDHLHQAEHGKRALEILEHHWVDLVFSDIHMPEMTGVELVEAMSHDELLASIPVVIVSSDRSEARIEQLMVRGAKAYVRKPFRPETLRDTVEQVMALAHGGNDERRRAC